MKPYLESATVKEEVKKDDSEYETESPIKEVNRENFQDVLNENKISVVAVFARRCAGCRELEPKLPELHKMLAEEVGHKKVGVVKVDIFNEAHFLKHIEKTPSFLLYEKKGNSFWDLGTSDFEEITKTVDRIHKQSYRY